MKLTVIWLSFVLGGCVAVFPIPNFSQMGANACLGVNAYIGQRVGPNADGKYGVVKKIHGASERCRKDKTLPILAEVEYEEK